MNDPEPIESYCIVDGCHGIYVPQNFAKRHDMASWHVAQDDVDILLSGPDNEFYWETWDDVLRDAYYVDGVGLRFTLEQDGDLFAVRYADDDNA